MKKIITVFILLLTISTSLFSKEKKETSFIWEDVEYNSISAIIDENTLIFHSDKQYERLDIQIQNLDGTVVYTNRVSIQAGTEFPIFLSNLLEETSQIILIVNSQIFSLYL